MKQELLHRQGTMRLVIAGEELYAMQHHKVRQNLDYVSFVEISSVIT